MSITVRFYLAKTAAVVRKILTIILSQTQQFLTNVFYHVAFHKKLSYLHHLVRQENDNGACTKCDRKSFGRSRDHSVNQQTAFMHQSSE